VTTVLVTGSSGYLGRQLVTALASAPDVAGTVVALDVREPPPEAKLPAVVHVHGDVRDPGLVDVVREHDVVAVVHLAAVVTPAKGSTREEQRSIDVDGTRNVVQACVAAGVGQLVVTSSGAAYGYHADNPVPLSEDDPLRGNPAFAYADHKRQVEDLLAEARADHPELHQLVLRPGAILGDSTGNQITDLFERRLLLGVRGSDAPFSFVWDGDVVACILHGLRTRATGVYNLAGDGTTTMPEIARRLGKPYVAVPAWLIRGALAVLHPLRLSQYGPEQVDFLRYRPVLSNRRLKHDLGYVPQLTSTQVFERYLRAHGLG
jgi:UDP-glucose 4-epimerase